LVRSCFIKNAPRLASLGAGNCLFMTREFHRAKELYLEAIGVQADCVEAIYNLGLTNMRMSSPEEARQGERAEQGGLRKTRNIYEPLLN